MEFSYKIGSHCMVWVNVIDGVMKLSGARG